MTRISSGNKKHNMYFKQKVVLKQWITMLIIGRAKKQVLGLSPRNDSQNNTRFTCREVGIMGNQKVSIDKRKFTNMPAAVILGSGRDNCGNCLDTLYVEHSCLSGTCLSTPMKLVIWCWNLYKHSWKQRTAKSAMEIRWPLPHLCIPNVSWLLLIGRLHS